MFRPGIEIILAVCLLCGLLAGPTSAQPPSAKDVPLLNGKNYAGWLKYTSDRRANLNEFISIEPHEKYIIIKGTSPGYLVTEKMYSDYQLSLEWRWAPKQDKPTDSSKRSSGVLFHIAGEADLIWPKSIQADLRAGRAGDLNLMSGFKLSVNPERSDPKNNKHFLRSHDGVEKPPGEWNQCVITCHGKFVSITINGTMVMAGKEAEYSKGRIALQSEAGEIHFRNLMMKQLEGKPVDPEKDN